MRYTWAWALVLGLPLSLHGQAADSPSTAELVRTLLTRIDQLEKRVAELEKGSPGTARVSPAALATNAPPNPASPEAVHAERPQTPMEAMHQEHLQLGTAADAQQIYPALKLAGFSDLNFGATTLHGAKSGFTEGQFVLHFSSALSPKVSAFGELSFGARADAGTGSPPATGFNVEVERAIVRYDQSDNFKVSFGRYHTPINYWNTAFHHGQWLQTTVSRPEMTQFGGRFIPVHFVGALVEGAVPAGGLNVNYNFGIGNGRGSVISRGGDAGDVNNNRAWLINVFSKPDRPFGLQFGGSVYRDLITLASGRNFREWISSGHIVWHKENPELIAEVANVNHHEVGRANDFNSQAYYVQLAYRLPWLERLWKPYYRWEYIHVPKGDAVFSALPNLNLAGSTAGVRYEISSYAAIKAEYRNQKRPGLPRINGLFLQTSFTF